LWITEGVPTGRCLSGVAKSAGRGGEPFIWFFRLYADILAGVYAA
jgi:hypothetical protein